MAGVAGRLDVVCDRIGKPQEIVRAARPNALAGSRQPPMLHVALDELPAGGAQEMLAFEPWLEDRNSHHILDLVAEPIGAARLVIAAAGEEAAGNRLRRSPVVQEGVERIVRSTHHQAAEEILPDASTRAAADLAAATWRCAVTSSRTAAFRSLSEGEDHFALLSRRQIEDEMHRGAGIEPRPDLPESASRPTATGRSKEPFRPRNSSRSPVAQQMGSLAATNATRSG